MLGTVLCGQSSSKLSNCLIHMYVSLYVRAYTARM